MQYLHHRNNKGLMTGINNYSVSGHLANTGVLQSNN